MLGNLCGNWVKLVPSNVGYYSNNLLLDDPLHILEKQCVCYMLHIENHPPRRLIELSPYSHLTHCNSQSTPSSDIVSHHGGGLVPSSKG
ncbi:unnamed protein product [Prunus armeniaca]